MPATNLNFPYDPELFLLQWRNAPDPTRTAILESGAMVANAELRNLIANGSDVFTMPFYDTIGGTPDNYDGVSDITVSDVTGHSQSGVVYGRAHSWKDSDFIRDFNSGADPMRQITSQVGRYWSKQRQGIMLDTLKGIFSIADDSTDKWDEWALHTSNFATSTTSVTDANKINEATAGDAAQKAVGDNAGIFTMAVMHSKIANELAKKQLLNFRKYTDAMGIERQLNIADYNGMTVIVDDGVPTADSASASGNKEYTTFLLGAGALQYAPAPVDIPVEINREAKSKGGYNEFITRLREAMHPNGFSFKVPTSGYTKSPTNAQLAAGANWMISGVPKSIAIARIVTNG